MILSEAVDPSLVFFAIDAKSKKTNQCLIMANKEVEMSKTHKLCQLICRPSAAA